jgi:hypothetical protein
LIHSPRPKEKEGSEEINNENKWDSTLLPLKEKGKENFSLSHLYTGPVLKGQGNESRLKKSYGNRLTTWDPFILSFIPVGIMMCLSRRFLISNQDPIFTSSGQFKKISFH